MPISTADILILVGLALIATGLAFIYWPLALIVPGCLMLAMGLAAVWGGRGAK